MSFTSLQDFLAVKEEHYHECVDIFGHNFVLDGIKGEIRFHHLKFDGNGLPMAKALAEVLYEYIIDYCLSTKNRPASLNTQQAARLTKEARKLFRKPEISEDDPDNTGEAGEALLFFLTEAVLKAPQLVAKMELKTNHKDEVKGSDGIHIKWNETDQLVDFYFGESKLYKDVGGAISSAIKSINSFHDHEMYKHEFLMVTKHFKYADDIIKEEISSLIKLGEPSPKARINHACLIGYDWSQYGSFDPKNINADFKEKLLIDGENVVKKLNKAFDKFEKKYLRFEVFFIPFPSVVEFRNAFNKALG